MPRFLPKPTLTDDRSREVPEFGPRDVGDDRELQLIFDRLRESSNALHEAVTVRSLAVIVVLIVVMIGFAALVSALRFPTWVVGVVYVAAILAAAPLWWWAASDAMSMRIVNTLLAHGRCASCGYRLAGALPASDQCVQCPECSAAWRLGRVGSTPVVSSDISPDALPDRRGIQGWFLRSFWDLPTIVDDRHRAGALVDPSLKHLGSDVVAERATRLRRDIFWSTLFIRSAVTLLCVSVLVLFAFTAGRRSWVILIVLAIAYGSLLYRTFRNRTRSTSRSVRKALLRAGLCPFCAGDLLNSHPEHDNTRACPRCAAHWLLPHLP